MSRAGSAGFAVPAVLVAIALLSLAVWTAADTSDDLNGRLRALRTQLALETAAATAEARVAHLLLTEPVGQRSIRVGAARFGDPVMDGGRPPIARLLRPSNLRAAELVLDGRPYQMSSGEGTTLFIEVQDEAGLLNLNGTDEAVVANALAALGLDEARARAMAGALADYTDADELRRLNGAEARDYRRAGLLPPRNAPLGDASGVAAILGWPEALTRTQERALREIATAGPPNRRLNLNSAPATVLKAALGLDERATDTLVESREDRTLVSSSDVFLLTGALPAVGDAALGGLPGRHIRLTVRSADGRADRALAHRSRLTIAPTGAARPVYWRRTPVRRAPPSFSIPTESHPDELPQSPALSAS